MRPTATEMDDCWYGANPSEVALRVYVELGNSLSWNEPSAEEETEWEGPSVPDKVIVAATTGLPSEAVTVPVTTPLLED